MYHDNNGKNMLLVPVGTVTKARELGTAPMRFSTPFEPKHLYIPLSSHCKLLMVSSEWDWFFSPALQLISVLSLVCNSSELPDTGSQYQSIWGAGIPWKEQFRWRSSAGCLTTSVSTETTLGGSGDRSWKQLHYTNNAFWFSTYNEQ